MANLIPPQAKRVVRREYWMRVAATWAFLGAVASFVTAVLLLPTYVLIDRQQEAYANQFAAAQSQQDAFESAREELTTANDLVRHIRRENAGGRFVSLFSRVDAYAVEYGVTVRQMIFRQTIKGFEPMKVIGEAQDRTSLAAFRDALEADAAVAAVDLPISNLAGGRNIPFSITLDLVALE